MREINAVVMYFFGVAAKLFDVVVHPLQCEPLIEQAEVVCAGSGGFGSDGDCM
jgi:hypothetical protein